MKSLPVAASTTVTAATAVAGAAAAAAAAAIMDAEFVLPYPSKAGNKEMVQASLNSSLPAPPPPLPPPPTMLGNRGLIP